MKSLTMRSTTFVFIAAVLVVSSLSMAKIPPHPDKIVFAPLAFEPPDAKTFRHTLSNGVVVYLAPGHEFPLINLAFTFKGGDFLEPADKVGLAGATGSMMRRGGAGDMNAQTLDEEIDFLAAQIGTFCGDTQSGASLNCLKSNFAQSFKLFMDVVRRPTFQADRLDVLKGEVLEGLKQRNDDAGPILNREWSALLYGREHFESREPTKASIDSISIDDLKMMHKRIFHPGPGNLYIAVTGDFDEKEMLSTLEQAFEGWTPGETVPQPPAPPAAFAPGLYHVEKDIPQGKVYIGLRAIKRDDPDYFPLLLMNNILGGGGFTSRITNSVRSDEGLAYSAGSSMSAKVYYPGEFRASFQSKNATVALATKIIMDEIDHVRAEPVKKDELELAKDSFIETLPRAFESKPVMLNVFISDEITNRPANYWKTYRDKVRAVTAEDIQRVAQKYLAPDKLAIFIVGKWSDISTGNDRAKMADIMGGKVTHLPLRDPLTLEAVK